MEFRNSKSEDGIRFGLSGKEDGAFGLLFLFIHLGEVETCLKIKTLFMEKIQCIYKMKYGKIKMVWLKIFLLSFTGLRVLK